MPGITQEQKVAALANQIVATILQLNSVNATITSISAAWTNLSAANKLNAFPTAPLTSSGGIGTPDATPNVANPINTSVSVGSETLTAISANNYASMLTYLQSVQSALNGSAISANGAAPQLVALCL